MGVFGLKRKKIMNNKILITTSSFSQNLLDSLSDFEIVLNPYKRKLEENELLALLIEHEPIAIIAGVEKYTKNILDEAREFLKIISRCGIGLDSIDLEAAKEYNIKILNTPDAPTMPVSELTLGLILDCLRGISNSNLKIKNGQFERPMGNLLYEKTVGIVGCGRIGSYLAKLLVPFQCEILGYDPYLENHPMIKLTTLENLLKNSDIVSLHIPYSEENKYIISKNELEIMKSTSILINASRGGLICEDSLYDALKNGTIKACALDCFENEPYNGKLRELDNATLTGHIGSYAKEARLLQENQSVENLLKELVRGANEI